MTSFCSFVRVPVDQDADAALQRAGDVDFVTTHQRHVEPAQLARGEGGEFGVQILGNRKVRVDDVLRFDAVQANHQRQQISRLRQDLFAGIGFHRGGPADSSASHLARLPGRLGLVWPHGFKFLHRKRLRREHPGRGHRSPNAPARARDFPSRWRFGLPFGTACGILRYTKSPRKCRVRFEIVGDGWRK